MKLLGGIAGRGRTLSLGIIIAGALLLAPRFASAATLSVSPSSGKFGVGRAFSVVVRVNTQGAAVNASEGVLSFNPAQLQVVSVSTAGSINNLNVQDPDFSNAAGTVRWAGVILNPGFTGTSGNLLTVTFKGVSAGQAQVNFASGAVLANDGQGTNVLSKMSGGTYEIGTAPTASPPTPLPPSPLPTDIVPALPDTSGLRPIIVQYPDRVGTGTPFMVAGRSDQDVAVRIKAFQQPGRFERILYSDASVATSDTNADSSGQWFAQIPGLPSGDYYLVADTIDVRGVVTASSEPVTVSVGHSLLWRIGNFFRSLVSLDALRFLLLFLILLCLWWLFVAWRRRRHETVVVVATSREERKVSDLLAHIASDMDEEIALLGGIAKNRPLYPEEKYLRSKLAQYRRAMKSLLWDTHSRLAKKK